LKKKGYKYLIEASPLVLKKHPNLTFVIIGGGDQHKKLVALTKKLGVSDSFRFLGWVDFERIVHYYNLGDIFILPSVRDEAGNLDDQSVSVVDAMAVGLPIITTDFPGYRIVVKNGINGFLTKEKDVTQLAQAIDKLVSSKTLRMKMGKKSRELVLKNFSWEAIGKQYYNLFKKVLNEQKKR